MTKPYGRTEGLMKKTIVEGYYGRQSSEKHLTKQCILKQEYPFFSFVLNLIIEKSHNQVAWDNFLPLRAITICKRKYFNFYLAVPESSSLTQINTSQKPYKLLIIYL